MIPEGTYRARGEVATPHVNKNGKDAVAVTFYVLDGEHESERVSDVWYLATDQSARITLGKLRAAGCELPGGDVAHLDDFGSVDCDITVRHEVLTSGKTVVRIQYVDEPGRSGGARVEPLTPGEAKAFAARWRHVAQSLGPSKRKPVKAKDAEDVPF